MIRWKAAAPRAIVVTVFAAFMLFGMNPLIRYSALELIQRTTGARVEIGAVHAQLHAGHLSAHDMTLAHDSSGTAISVKSASLKFDAEAVAHRRIVVDEAAVRELVIGGPLPTGTPPVSVEQLPEDDPAGGANMSEWLDGVDNKLLEYAESGSETVQVAQQLRARWPVEIDDLKRELKVVRTQSLALRDSLQSGGNTLEKLSRYQQSIQEVKEIHTRADAIYARVQQFETQARLDRSALETAARNDMEKLREHAGLATLNPQELASFLLGKEQAEMLSNILVWVQYIRSWIPSEGGAVEPERVRGRDVWFAGVPPKPDFLIRKTLVTGKVQYGGEWFPFAGAMNDVCSHQTLINKPITLHLVTQGQQRIEIRAQFDRRRGSKQDVITFDYPAMPVAAHTLGDRDKFALETTAGSARLRAVIQLNGNQLHGRVLYQHPSPGLKFASRSGFSGRVADRMNASLGEMQTLEALAEVTGELGNPKWKLESNLGQKLADVASQTYEAELNSIREKVAAKVQEKIGQETAALDQLLASQSKLMADDLNLVQQARNLTTTAPQNGDPLQQGASFIKGLMR